ncbi:unnamed protein product [Cuscuta campestris]|uniref:VQ domain-containing protein n=1 Tax=Cuscuta campestris TaxID=132261 RepID=A0A484LR18_9ASTE|nr:unnamed protein product [Cuscuta campestris]
MDSGNSSSGGGGGGDNEEYDSSRGGEDPISGYFIYHFESNAGSQLFLSSIPPALSSPYFDNNQQHDLIGPGPSLSGLLFGGSEPGFATGLADFVPNPTSSSSPILVGARQENGHFLDPSSSAQPAVENPGPGSGSAAPKNPKKRSRASRRAPTTVLATDIANFRQMVQEFTGIPADPFARRLDLFSAAASPSALMRPAHFDGPPLLRPSSSAAQSPGLLFNTGSGSNPSTNNTNNLGITTQDEPDLLHHPLLQSGNQEPILKSNQTEDRSS